MTTARTYPELMAWQLGEAFHREAIRLLAGSHRALADRDFCAQIRSAASSVAPDVAEGFLRNSPAEFRRFLSYALGSLGEAETRIRHGITAGYFSREEAATALNFAKRCSVATSRLRRSQDRYIARQQEERKSRKRPDRTRRT